MKNRGMIAAAIVLATLLGFLYWSDRHPPNQKTPAEATPSEPAPNILTLNVADVTKIEIRKKGIDQVVITKNDEGKWQITSPKSLASDQEAVSGMLSTLSSLTAERLVDENATNLGRYGLAEPALEVQVSDKNNSAHKLLIGDDTPTTNATYVRRDGDPRVFTIASYTKTAIDKGLNDLRDKRLITVEPDKISRLEVSLKQQRIEFGRDKEQWQILKPKPLRADGSKVEELVSKITEAKMDLDENADATKTAAAFAAGAAIATAKVTTDSGTQWLEVRKNKEDYYAKSSITDGAFKVASDLGQAFDKKVDDFRNKKLFDFGLDDANKIEMHAGGQWYFLTKGGEDWWSADGKKYEQTSALALIDKLRDLEATAFAESGFGTPAIEIVVKSSEGKVIEKVLFSKASKSPLARREHEPALYVMDSQIIEELQKLGSELKPEAAAAK